MKIKGQIISISDVEVAGSGKKLNFQIDTKEEYNNIISFDMFKSGDYIKHVEEFSTFNNVGDTVEVEFNIKSREYQGRWYTNLEAWRVNKPDRAESTPTETFVDESSDMPF